jgi:hypothetical protein
MTRRLRTWFFGLGLLVAAEPIAVAQPPNPELLPKAAVESGSSAVAAPPAGPNAVVSSKPMDALTVDVRPSAGAMPDDVAAKLFGAEPTISGNRDRGFGGTLYFWEASNLAHRPLYFEQAYVERYGYNYRCLQPVVSGVEFYTDFALLPVTMAAHIRRPYIYALGPARPGTRGVPEPRW